MKMTTGEKQNTLKWSFIISIKIDSRSEKIWLAGLWEQKYTLLKIKAVLRN